MRKQSKTSGQARQMPKSSHRNFRLNLRQLRRDNSWTQQSVGDALGVSRCYIADLERGRNVPTLAQVDRIAKALRVSPVWLIGDPEENLLP